MGILDGGFVLSCFWLQAARMITRADNETSDPYNERCVGIELLPVSGSYTQKVESGSEKLMNLKEIDRK
jgi:hypothetical protein